MTTALLDVISGVQQQLRNLRETLVRDPEVAHYRRSLTCIDELASALSSDFDLPRRSAARVSKPKPMTIARLKRSLAYQRKRRGQVQKELTSALSCKMSGRISNIYFIRVALADPNICAQSMSEFLRDFPASETNHIHRSYVSSIRMPFASLRRACRKRRCSMRSQFARRACGDKIAR